MGKPKTFDLTFALGDSNLLTAGDASTGATDTVTLVYSGSESEVPKVTVNLVEIDDAETIGQTTGGRDDAIATFTGKIENGSFVLEGSKIATTKLPDTTPHTRVSIGGQTFEKVKLPGADKENALFELGVVVTAGTSKYRSEWRAYVRHFTVRPADGPVMAFITGAEDGSYFSSAQSYWKKHADAVLVKDGMSLEEIVGFLATHKEGFGRYGEVNIVAHGNRISALIRIVNGGERELRLKKLYRTLGMEGEEAATEDTAGQAAQAANREKFNHSADDLGLDDKSRVVFRACNIGNRPDLLQAVRKNIFADACSVKAPKYLQGYSTGDLNTRKATAPFEFFAEDLQRHVPGTASPPRKAKPKSDGESQEELMQSVFADAHSSLDFDAEKDSYTPKLTPIKAPYGIIGPEAYFYDFSANRAMSDSDLLAKMETGFDEKRDEDMNYTRWGQWKSSTPTRKDRTEKVGGKTRTVTTDNLWVTVNHKKAVPSAIFLPPGIQLVVGSDAALGQSGSASEAPGGVTIPDPKVAARHATLRGTGDHSLEVTAEEDQTITYAGKKVESCSGTAPLKFSVGPAGFDTRPERERIAETSLSRVLVHWRRPLRQDDAGVPYKERALVVPDTENSDHYGSSEDSQPSEEDLANLSA